VYIRVLKVPSTSNLIYQVRWFHDGFLRSQQALLSSEVRQIFASAPEDPTVLANDRVRKKYQQLTAGPGGEEEEEEEKEDGRRPIEGDCPICYEEMRQQDATVWCVKCGNNLHTECFSRWRRQKLNSNNVRVCGVD
jgi:hypothetical protein